MNIKDLPHSSITSQLPSKEELRLMKELQERSSLFGLSGVTENLVRKQMEAIGVIAPAYLNHFKPNTVLAEIIGKNSLMFQQSNLSEIQSTVAKAAASAMGSAFLSGETRRAIESLYERFAMPSVSHSKIMENLVAASNAQSLAYSGVMVAAIEGHKQLLASPRFADTMSHVIGGYSKFAENTLVKLGAIGNKSVAYALQGSLILANEQTLRSIESLQSIAGSFRIPESQIVSRLLTRDIAPVNRYRVQRDELIQRIDIEEDENYETLVLKSPTAAHYEIVSSCMRLIGSINEILETDSAPPIFMLTSTVMISFSTLLEVVATNRQNFSLVVDCLYLILCEGAGGGKLRYIERGYVNKDEADVIRYLKHLRNKWLRHDNHGSEGEIRKTRNLRKETIQWFGFEKLPLYKADYVAFQVELLRRIEEFLRLLLERVSGFSE